MPWQEANALLGDSQQIALQAVMQATSTKRFPAASGNPSLPVRQVRDIDLRFFEATVFGHPLEWMPGAESQLFCKPVTKAGKPYYQSTLDALAWRFALVESFSAEALTPGLREIGTSDLSSWGAVYPRSGFVVQQSPAKAAAVIAQRACDIVIGPSGDHVVMPLETAPPQTFVSNVLDERDASTGLWQMVHPYIDDDCNLFGTDDAAWELGRLNQTQNFLWNLWRPYECCEPRGEKYLGVIHF